MPNANATKPRARKPRKEQSRFVRFTEERRAVFLHHLKQGYTITGAARAAGTLQMTAYKARAADPEFKAQWDEALEEGLDRLEDEVVRRAVDGVDEPVFHRGEVVGHVRKYSDTLLIFKLKGHRPERYRDNYEHTIKGADGGPLALTVTFVDKSDK